MSDLNDILQHYGVLGMKWGRRKNRRTSSDYKKTLPLRKKSASELSNEELTTLNKRLNLEKQYSSLNPSRAKRGQAAVKNVMAGIGAVAATAGAIKGLVEIGNKLMKAKG